MVNQIKFLDSSPGVVFVEGSLASCCCGCFQRNLKVSLVAVQGIEEFSHGTDVFLSEITSPVALCSESKRQLT